MLRGAVVIGALVLAMAGCDPAGPDEPDPDGGGQVAETIEDVAYYYACGNEVLQLPDGRRFYPFVDQDAARPSADANASVSSRSVRLAAATLAVPAPSPGDDTGTLTIYEDGTARFVSDSGTEAWLTDDEQTYNWVC